MTALGRLENRTKFDMLPMLSLIRRILSDHFDFAPVQFRIRWSSRSINETPDPFVMAFVSDKLLLSGKLPRLGGSRDLSHY